MRLDIDYDYSERLSVSHRKIKVCCLAVSKEKYFLKVSQKFWLMDLTVPFCVG